MSDKLFYVTLTDDEVALVKAFIDRPLVVRAAPVRNVKPKAEPRDLSQFEIATGDDRLDAFMRRSRERTGLPVAPRKAKPPVFPYGCKQLTSKPLRDSVHAFNNAAVAAWRRRGYVVNIEALDKSGNVALDGRNVTVVGLTQ